MEPFDFAVSARRFQVGAVTVDTASRVVTVDGHVQPVELKPLDMFIALLDRAGDTLSRAQLKIAGWGNDTINDGSLDEAISRLRRRLSPYGNEIIVRAKRGSVPGYQIGLPVETWITNSTPRLSLNFLPGDRIGARPDWRLAGALDPASLVWRAIRDADGRPAVFLFADTPDRADMLRREAHCARTLQAALGEPNGWLPVIDSDLDSWPPFIVRPFAQTSLAGFSAEQRLYTLQLDARVAIIAQLARCVGRAHEAGIVHGAIRPENVFFDIIEGGIIQPRLSRFLGAACQATLPNDSSNVWNRHPYLAPEHDGSGVPTAEGDIYALGILLFQLVKGSCATPVGADGMADLPDQLLREDIGAAVAVDPTRRLGSAASLADRLETLPQRRIDVEQRERQTQQLRQQTRRTQHMRRTATVVAIVLMVAGISAWAIRNAQSAAAVRNERVAQIAELVKVANSTLVEDIAFHLGDTGGVPLPTLIAWLDRADGTLQGLIRLAPNDKQLLRLEARGLTEFARAYFHQGAVVRARDEAARASAIQHQLLIASPNDEKVLADLAQSERWMGDIELEQRDFAGALAADEDVVRIVDRLVVAGPSLVEGQSRLGRAEDAVGFVQMSEGDNQQALLTFRAAQKVFATAITQSDASAALILDLAVNQQRIGDALEGLGSYKDALSAYQVSIPMFRRLVALDGSNNTWLRDLLISEGDVGDEQVRMKDYKAALSSYLGTLEGAQQLANSDPTNAEWQRDLAVNYTEIGDAKGDIGDNPGAAAAYRSAETVFATLIAHAPDDVSLEHDFVVMKMNLADSLDKNGDKVGAYPFAVDALLQARSLADAQPRSAEMTELVRLAKGVLQHLAIPHVP